MHSLNKSLLVMVYYFLMCCRILFVLCVCVQSCLTLHDPLDYRLPGSSVHRIFQARKLEWVAISSSRGSSWPRNWTCISCVSCIAGRFFTCWAIEEALMGGIDTWFEIQSQGTLGRRKREGPGREVRRSPVSHFILLTCPIFPGKWKKKSLYIEDPKGLQ